MLSREIVLAFKRRHIEDALAELCLERGYRATTIADISRRTRVARATIYEHFENKENAFLSLLDRASQDLFDRVEAACASVGEDSEQRLEAGIGALLAWVAEEPPSAWACLVESLCATPESLRHYLKAIERFTTLLAGAVPNEVPRPATTEESLVGGVASLLSGLLRSGDAQRAPELAPQLLIFLRGPFLAA
jgi:AcrR family transcriptional regulator